MPNDEYRAAYIEYGGEFGHWLSSLWTGKLSADDPLSALSECVGEANAWGDLPHSTLTDALSFAQPDLFDKAVSAIVSARRSPRISIEELKLFNNGGAAVITVDSSPLGALKVALQSASELRFRRIPISHEEFARAEWWIREVGGGNEEANLMRLTSARERYRLAGSPPLASSQHFRLGYLLRLSDAIDSAKDSEESTRAEERIARFLRSACPHWYGSPSGLHITLASGLTPGTWTDEKLANRLWEPAVEKFGEYYEPRHVVIMGDDPTTQVEVRFWDDLTQTYVVQRRPGLKVVKRVPFAADSRPIGKKSKSRTALLMDVRGSNPADYVEQVLRPCITADLEVDRLQVMVTPNRPLSNAGHAIEKKRWSTAFDEWSKGLPFRADVIYDHSSGRLESGPCSVWSGNIQTAFEDEGVDQVAYLPIDVKDLDQQNTDTIKEFVDQARAFDFQLGNYTAISDPKNKTGDGVYLASSVELASIDTPVSMAERFMGGCIGPHGGRVDIAKNLLDHHAIVQALVMFPNTMETFFGHREFANAPYWPMIRSGYFSLSRNLFNGYRSRPFRPSMPPWAATVSLLLFTMIANRFNMTEDSFSWREKYLGLQLQKPEGWDYRHAHQTERIAYVIRDEAHYWSRQPQFDSL